MRLAPSDMMYPDTAAVKLAADARDGHGGNNPAFTATGTIRCYVETNIDQAKRRDGEENADEVGSTTDYHVFSRGEPGALAGLGRAVRVDDVFAWRGKTLKALGPAAPQAQQWVTEAKEYR